jgi:hypothetical protein
MDAELKRQQREIDRQMAMLAENFSSAAPPADVIARVKSAVEAEAERLRQRDHRLVVLRPLLGAAAALLLAIGLSLTSGNVPTNSSFAVGGDPDAVFAAWVDALDESGDQFTRLLGDDWLLMDPAPSDDGRGEGDDPLDSLEESLESLEQIIGV